MEEVVLSRKYSAEDVRLAVIVGEINPKDTSMLLERLSSSYPLHSFALGHLKRVRRRQCEGGNFKLELLLCPAEAEEQLSDEIRCKLLSTSTLSVCRVPPLTRTEFEEWHAWWPTNFRPNDVDREREKGPSNEELFEAAELMQLARQDAERCLVFYQKRYGPNVQKSAGGTEGGGIIVNPSNRRIVACCRDVLELQFRQDPHESEGALGALQQPTTTPAIAAATATATAAAATNIGHSEAKVPTRMQQVLLAPALLCVEGVALVVNTGATLPCHSVIVPSTTTHMDSPLLPDDAYLCTGLDLYLTHEPNVLCAMALVHSRIRRVYFMEAQSQYGALASHYHLHSMRALNHKYRVFRVLPELLDAKIKS